MEWFEYVQVSQWEKPARTFMSVLEVFTKQKGILYCTYIMRIKLEKIFNLEVIIDRNLVVRTN